MRRRGFAYVAVTLGTVAAVVFAIAAAGHPGLSQEPENPGAEVAAAANAVEELPDEAIDDVETTRLLVKVDEEATPTEKEEILNDLEAVGDRSLDGEWMVVETADPISATQATAELADQAVADVEMDMPLVADATPNDPYYGSEWGLEQANDVDIDAAAAWDVTRGSNDVIVAVIDTGVQTTHPDLAANIWQNPNEIANNGVDDDGNGFVDDMNCWDFYNNDKGVYDSYDGDEHGTHVAGTIGAVTNNGVGVAGIAWNVRLMTCKFIGPYGGWTSDAIDAIEYAVDKGADVINASWGGGGYSSALKSAIDAAGAAGVLFVAAAGNDNTNTDSSPHYPSSYTSSNLISVAAITSGGARASFSNYGAASVDLGAPGVSIVSTVPTVPAGSYAYYSGTSMATPHVSGVAALKRAASPTISVTDLKGSILNNTVAASSMAGITVTGGILNAWGAIVGTSGSPSPGSPTGVVGTHGDFNGDGRDDVVTFTKDATGDVYVATSDGSAFHTYGQKWHDWFAVGSEIPAVGDFNGDGLDDVVTFTRGTLADVYVKLSDGTAFSSGGGKWHDWFAVGSEMPIVGDFNGDGKDDIGTATGGGAADVYVALSTGSSFGASALWSGWFVAGTETPAAGDFNGDGRDDLVSFTKASVGDVFVAKSNGTNAFSGGEKWHDYFAVGSEIPAVGDVNRDGTDDVVVFTGGSTADVYVSRSSGSSFGPGEKWHDYFAVSGETPGMGDFNGDGWDDIVVFTKGSLADVYAKLSNGSSFPFGGGKWHDYFAPASEVPQPGYMP